MVVGQDFPRAHWMLDDASPYADYSGYERSAVCTSPTYGTSLAKSAERSLILSNSSRLTVDTPVFKQGKEYLTFSVEAFVRPIISDPNNITEQQIWGNDGVMDGLTMNGTVVSLVTKFADGTEARASFDLMDLQSFAAVGIHTEAKNILYINGDQVAEVVITHEQKLSTFVATGANQSCGASTSSNSFMLNSLSIYDLELDEESAMTHYANAQDTLGAEDVAIDYRGALLEFGVEGQLSPFFTIDYSSEEEWQLGHRVNCALNDGTLYPSVSQGVSVAGYWETVIPLGVANQQIYAANLLWEGVGATVETSRDGSLWVAARKGVALTTVPKGTNGDGEFLFVRVSFDGGVVNDPSFFDNLVFSLYTSGTITNFSGREVILDKATPEDDTDVIDYHQNWGAEMESGTLTIKAPVGDMGVKARTIEVWAMKGGTFTDNLGAANRIRSNGGPQKAFANGEWQLRHYVFDADFTGDIVFSGTAQIGHVILYPEALSDAVITEIYDSYTGKPKIQVDVDEVFDIHEFAGQVDIYEYDWSIESSG